MRRGATSSPAHGLCEMAAKIDSQAWALRSPHGAFLSRWLAARRGLRRFEGESAIYYFLHTRHLDTTPAMPSLAMLAGKKKVGMPSMRSGWDDGRHGRRFPLY